MATKVPTIKNGPKGISLFNPFFLKTISITPIIAPKKNAKNRATKTLGKPNKSPIKTASFTSPKPIHLPFEIRKIERKKPDAITTARKLYNIVLGLNKL